MKKINLKAVEPRMLEITDTHGATRQVPNPESITVPGALALVLRGMPRYAANGQAVQGTSTVEVMDRMEIHALLTAAVNDDRDALLLEDAQYAKLKMWTEAYEWAFATPEVAACLGAILRAETVVVTAVAAP